MHGRIREYLLYTVVLGWGVGLAFWPTISSGFTLLQTDPGDTLLNHYILEHSWLWLTRSDYVGTLWSPPFYFPAPGALAYSENLLGVAPLYWLLRLGGDAVLAYQLWMIGVCALSYAGMVWVLRRFDVQPTLVALGGLIFAFGMPRLQQLGHQQLLVQAFTPPAIYFAYRFLTAPTARHLYLAYLFISWQLWACIYLGWFLVFTLPLFALGLLIGQPTLRFGIGRFLVEHRYATLAGTLLFGMSLFPLLEPYQRYNHGFRRNYEECLLPCKSSWLAPPDGSLWAAPLERYCKTQDPERRLFPGLLPIMLLGLVAMTTLFRRKSEDNARGLAIATFFVVTITVLLTFRWHSHTSLWFYVYSRFPGAGAIRAVSRIELTLLAYVLMAGIPILSRLLRAKPSGELIAWLVLFIGIADQVTVAQYSFDPRSFCAEVEAKATEIRGLPWACLPLEEAGRPFYTGQLVAMWAGLKANVPVVNGYTGRHPKGYPAWNRTLTPEEAAEWVRSQRAPAIER